MTLVPLKSYLRTYRKRAGLTHDELAFLCGAMSGTSVARHENAKRLPLLRTALIYEVVLRVPVRAIYERVVYDARQMVRRRAVGLRMGLERKPRTKSRDHKIAHLAGVIGDLDRGCQV
jgi:DNA-binding XRE family transcriptional regulator